MLAQTNRHLREASKEAARLIGSSRITLNSLSRDWAQCGATCDDLTLRVAYDPHASVPAYFAVSPVRENNGVQAKAMPIELGSD